MTIREMSLNDIEPVVDIHRERFADSRSGKLGRPFLRKIYKWFIGHYPALTLVAIDKDNKVIGFATGSVGPYTQTIFRNAIKEIIWGVIINPGLIISASTFKYSKNFIKGIFIRNKPVTLYGISAQEESKTISFASLAVTASSEGAGVPLIMAFESAARKVSDVDFASAWVKKKNESLIKIYKTFGWKVVWEDDGVVRLIKKISKN